jgi:acyl-CoA hydrolase
MTLITDSIDAAVTQILQNITGPIRLATPLGLGKPYYLLNALYDQVVNNPARKLAIYTALSLNPPVGKSELEKRFLTPFVERLYGADFPRLKYAEANSSDSLPDNIQVQEFYMNSGALLGSLSAQSFYASLNYTHVPEALASRDINVVVQKLAQDNQGNYSLACNTDLTLDTLDAITAKGASKPLCIGVVDTKLPFIGGEAVVDASLFEVIVTQDAGQESASNSKGYHKPIDAKLFAAPRQPVGEVDYAIGLYASTLVKDGGTLQIGIGALADALCHALVLRHTDNETYRRVLKALDPDIENHPTVQAFGGLDSFERGLYGCSEMLNEGFRLLVKHGIVKRRVVEDEEVMRRVANGSATQSDTNLIETQGHFLDGAFFLGSPEFYDWLRSLESTNNTVGMRRISQINSVIGEHFMLETYKRQHARFFNTCMMATALGGAASETLPDGKVVSGVGGQYNFVSMAHSLPKAKSVLLLRSTRTSSGKTKSNILWDVSHLTIPRHLRDVYITEYGIADLRYAADRECISAMLTITDSEFQQQLLETAQDNRKIHESALEETFASKQNTAEVLSAKLQRFRQDGTLPDYPLGSDFTDTEQDIVRALGWLKSNTQTTPDKLTTVFDVFMQSISDKFSGILGGQDREADADKVEQRVRAAMIRMGYWDTEGNEIDDDGLDSELLEHALRETL